jgi:hypothetical protein
MRKLAALTILLVLLIVPLDAGRAQSDEETAEAGTPEEIVSDLFDAMTENRMDDYADLMHPAALTDFRETFTPFFEMACENMGNTGIRELFPDVEDCETLMGMNDRVFFSTVLGGVMDLVPAMAGWLRSAEAEILGSVPEGNDSVHVVARMTMDIAGTSVSKVTVISVARYETGWRALLSGDIENLARAFQKGLTGGR